MLDIKTAKYYANYGEIQSINVELNKSNHSLSIPLDPDNMDYQAILEWVAEGNTIEPADE